MNKSREKSLANLRPPAPKYGEPMKIVPIRLPESWTEKLGELPGGLSVQVRCAIAQYLDVSLSESDAKSSSASPPGEPIGALGSTTW